MNQQSFKTAMQSIGYPMSDTQAEQFEVYRQFLKQQNQKMNLTALTEDADIYEKHFYDSCLILPLIFGAQSLCDVGSGAGFPGMVIAIMQPSLKVTLVEPTQKRCQFLTELMGLLKIDNVTVVNARAEDYTQGFEAFDVVTARAVSNLSILLEICIPLLKVGGDFVAMKGSQADQEVKMAANALKVLKAKVTKSDNEQLSDGSTRNNLVITKLEKTPAKYPRHYSQIKKKPL